VEVVDMVCISHARNEHPAPPVTFDIEGGRVVAMTVATKYTSETMEEIIDLLEEAGVQDK